MKNTSNKKEIRLKDLIAVDYTDDSWTDDEIGELAYDYYKRVVGVVGEAASDQSYQLDYAQTFWYKFNGGKQKSAGIKKFQDHLMKWVRDGKVTYVKDPTFAKFTNMADRYDLTFKDKQTLSVWVPKSVSDGDFVSFSTQNKFSRRGGSLFPPEVKAYQIVLKESHDHDLSILEEDTSLEEAYDTQLSKYELNGELKRVNDRIRFLRASHYMTALPMDIASELKKLVDLRDSILAMLKEEDIFENVDSEFITEALNIMQRMKRRAIMRRNKSKMLAGRRRASRRRASGSVIQQRAMRAARSVLAKRMLHKSKGDASYAEKVRIEKILASRQGSIKTLARKLVSRIRQKEQQKFQRRHATPPRPIRSVKPIETPKKPA